MEAMAITSINQPLRLWHLISAALPVGAFHYSQGLEAAVQQGWINDRRSAQAWICAGLHHSLAHVDLPLLARAWHAWHHRNEDDLSTWNAYLRACRETAELRAEDADMGAALMRLADAWDEPRPQTALGYTAMFAVLCVNNRISVQDTLMGYAWSWCENMSLAAIKLVPLGHLSGQRMLRDLSGEIEAAVSNARQAAVIDNGMQRIGAGLPGMVLASMLHEQQHSRVFRS